MKQLVLWIFGFCVFSLPMVGQGQASILDVETKLVKKNIRTDLSNSAYEADFTVKIRNKSPKRL